MLKAQEPTALYFKALGSYDIVALTESDAPPVDTTIAAPAASSCQTIPAAKLAGGYKSQSLSAWLAGAPIVGLTLFEFDKSAYEYDTPSALTLKLLRHLDKFRAQTSFSISAYAGFGQAEVVCLSKTESFEEIFRFLQYARSTTYEDVSLFGNERLVGDTLRYALLSSSFTVPLVSYHEVIEPEDFDRLKGHVSAKIVVACPAGFDGAISNDPIFYGATAQCSLGLPDILIDFHEPIAASRLVSNLIKFRSQWRQQNLNLVDTSTSIYFGTPAYSEPETYILDSDIDYPGLAETVGELFLDKLPYIASRIQSVTRHIESLARLRTTYPSIRSMVLVPQRLYGEAINYMEALDFPGEYQSYEGKLLRILDNADTGIAQRTAMLSDVSQHYHPGIARFADGVLSSILAIEDVVSFIYNAIDSHVVTNSLQGKPEPSKKTGVLDDSWRGYVFFSDTAGFEYHFGDVYSLPSEAIQSAVSPEINWLPLTHEISHAIFTMLDIDENESDCIVEALNRTYHFKGVPFKKPEEKYIRGMYFELFANWFDCYHFFDDDMVLFQTYIWKSWNQVPVVHEEKIEYVLRSFIVFALQNSEAIRSAVLAQAERSFIEKTWNQFLIFCEQAIHDIAVGLDFSGCAIEIIPLAEDFILPFNWIVHQHKYDEFRDTVTKPYDHLDSDVKAVFQGLIIEKSIPNPWIFLRECYRAAQKRNRQECFLASRAIIMSLRNNTMFMYDKNEQH